MYFSVQNSGWQWCGWPLKFPGQKICKSVVHSGTILKNLTGPPEMEEGHQILGAGGPLGQCPRKVISNPAQMFFSN